MDHKIHEPADRQVRAIAPDGIDTAFDTAGAEGLLAAVELAKNTNRVCTFYAYDLIEKLDLRTFAESVRQPALLSWWIFIQGQASNSDKAYFSVRSGCRGAPCP